MVQQAAVRVALVLFALVVAGAPLPAAAMDGEPAARVLVGFHAMPALAEGDAAYGGRVYVANPTLRFVGIQTNDASALARAAAADANVRYVEPDGVVHALGEMDLAYTPNDPQWASQYAPRQMRADLAWDTTRGSTAARVCVLDTGIRTTHVDLAGARFLGGFNFVANNTNVADDNGHGTAVAGVAVAGVDNGVGIAGLGNVGYYAVKVLDASGSGVWSRVANGITWCADNAGARTVQVYAFGGSSASQVVLDAVRYAHNERGHLLVAPTGAGGCSDCVMYPARYTEVMAVSCNDQDQNLCAFASTGPEVDLSAPGTSILTTCASSDVAVCTFTGSSFSAPQVAGVAALYWSHDGAIDALGLRARLRATAVDRGAPGHDTQYGYGRVDAKCLFDGNTSCSPTPPPACQGPPNDCFSSATPVGTLPYTATQTTNGANVEPEEPSPCGDIRATVWYRWVSPVTGTATIDTSGSDFDTVLAVHTGSSLPTLTTLACNDDAGGATSSVSVEVATGTTYWIQAGGRSGATGNLVLHVLGPQLPPGCGGNDQRAGACVIPAAPYVNAQSTAGFGIDANEPKCASMGATAWYRYEFIAPPKTIVVNTDGSDFAAAVGVYAAVGEALVGVACSAGSVTFTALPGLTYYIQAGGIVGATGDLLLTVTEE